MAASVNERVKMLDLVSPATAVSLLGLTFSEYVENYPGYSKLLATRYDEARIPAKAQEHLVQYPENLHLIFIVEDENPDTVAILPLLQRIADCCTRFRFYIVPAERDLTHIDQLLTDGDLDEELSEMELPLLLLFDDDWNFRLSWGPRPEAADGYLVQWLEDNPTYEVLATDDSAENQNAYLALFHDLMYSMRLWYNSGLQEKCVDELCSLFAALQEQNSSDEIDELENELE